MGERLVETKRQGRTRKPVLAEWPDENCLHDLEGKENNRPGHERRKTAAVLRPEPKLSDTLPVLISKPFTSAPVPGGQTHEAFETLHNPRGLLPFAVSPSTPPTKMRSPSPTSALAPLVNSPLA